MFTIKKKKFSEIDVNNDIFLSLKQDYLDFPKWFKRKEQDELYIVSLDGELAAVLYLKIECDEIDSKISPLFFPKKRLKIGTFKVKREGVGIGKRLMDFTFMEAKQLHIDEIYVTVYDSTQRHQKFISFIQHYGFAYHGYKGMERVYLKKM